MKFKFLIPKLFSRKEKGEAAKSAHGNPEKAHYQALDNSDATDLTGKVNAHTWVSRAEKLKHGKKFSIYGEMLHFPADNEAEYIDHAWINLIEIAASYNLKKEPRGWWIFSNRAKRFKNQMDADFPGAYDKFKAAGAVRKDASGAPAGKTVRYRRNIHALSNAIGFLASHRNDDGTFPDTIRDDKHGIKESMPAFQAFELYFTKVIETMRVRAKGFFLGLVSRLYSFFELTKERGEQYRQNHLGAGTIDGRLGNAKATEVAQRERSELLQTQVKELEDKLNAAVKEKEELQRTLDEQQPLVEQSQMSHEGIAAAALRDKQVIDQLRAEKTQLTDTNADLDIQLLAQKTTNEGLNNQLQRAQKESEALQNKTGQLTAELSQLTAARDALVGQLRAAEKKTQLMEQQIEQLSEQLAPVQEKANRVDAAEKSAEESQVKAGEFQAKNAEFTESLAQAEAQKATAEQALQAELTKVADLTKQVAKLGRKLEAQKQLADDEMSALGDTVTAVQAEKDKAVGESDAKLKEYQAKFDELSEAAGQAHAQKAAAKQALKAAQVEMESLRAQLVTQKESVSQVQAENYGVVEAVQAQNSELTAVNDALTARNINLQQEHLALQAKVQSLESDVMRAVQDNVKTARGLSNEIEVQRSEYQALVTSHQHFVGLAKKMVSAAGLNAKAYEQKVGTDTFRAFLQTGDQAASLISKHSVIHSGHLQPAQQVVEQAQAQEQRLATPKKEQQGGTLFGGMTLTPQGVVGE